MFKYAAIVLMAVIVAVSAEAKPGVIGAPLAYSAPLLAAPGAAVVSRTYHGASPYYSAPLVAAPAAYSAYSAYAAPAAYSAYAAPAAYSAYAAPAAYSAYSAYAAPAAYAAAPVLYK